MLSGFLMVFHYQLRQDRPFGGDYGLGKLLVREALVAGFFALVLYRMLPGAAGTLGRAIAVTLSNRFFHLLGELSFSIYLIHLLVLQPVAAFVFSQAMSSCRSFGGRPLRPMSTWGDVVSSATGSRSLSRSNDRA